jgi:hypothetical protein
MPCQQFSMSCICLPAGELCSPIIPHAAVHTSGYMSYDSLRGVGVRTLLPFQHAEQLSAQRAASLPGVLADNTQVSRSLLHTMVQAVGQVSRVPTPAGPDWASSLSRGAPGKSAREQIAMPGELQEGGAVGTQGTRQGRCTSPASPSPHRCLKTACAALFPR